MCQDLPSVVTIVVPDAINNTAGVVIDAKPRLFVTVLIVAVEREREREWPVSRRMRKSMFKYNEICIVLPL